MDSVDGVDDLRFPECERIVVSGYLGAGNVGDDAIGTALCKEIADHVATVKVGVRSESVVNQDAIEEFNLSLTELLRQITWSDTFVVIGGTHFHDRDKNLFRRFLIFLKYIVLNLFATILGKNVYYIGHGIGPLERTVFRKLFWVIRLTTDWISVRDPHAYKLTGEPDSERGVLAFDVAAMHSDALENKNERNDDPVLGVSVTAAQGRYFDQPEKDEMLVENLAAAINRVEKQTNIGKVHVYVFHTGPIDSDIEISEFLAGRLDTVSTRIIRYKNNPRKFLMHVDEADIFLAMRYHSVMYSYLCGKPTFIIPYHPKCEYFCEFVGYNQSSVADRLVPSEEELTERLHRLVTEQNRFKAEMSRAEAVSYCRRNFYPFTQSAG